MIYGLYLSAAGVMANSYRQDALASNLANSETVGYKRDLPLFQERLTAAEEHRDRASWGDPMLDNVGGGLFASPTAVDTNAGELEPTGNNLDLAIDGIGYFGVDDKGTMRLTRDGQFMVDRGGNLVLANGSGQAVLDVHQRPIVVDPRDTIAIAEDGVISQNGQPLARIGLFEVPDPTKLSKQGGNLLNYPDMQELQGGVGRVHSGFIERANVDPATELAALMDSQRQLEANANMIRYQDQMLSKLVNEVGKIS
jgi:flagellar basal body rod protein FlgG